MPSVMVWCRAGCILYLLLQGNYFELETTDLQKHTPSADHLDSGLVEHPVTARVTSHCHLILFVFFLIFLMYHTRVKYLQIPS